jgi:hypothetical protein
MEAIPAGRIIAIPFLDRSNKVKHLRSTGITVTEAAPARNCLVVILE